MTKAELAYSREHAATLSLIETLRQVVTDLPAPDGETSINWAHVGSMAELRHQLEQAAAFITNTQP